MKAVKYVLLIQVVFAFIACEKVIQPDLKNFEPQFVIEGVITNQGIPCEVKISKSVSFADGSSFEGVQNAFVSINDDMGNSETLMETSAGVYKTSTLSGAPGRTYYLKVTADGNDYHATCKMPVQISLDTLLQKSQIANDNVRRFIIPHYTDPSSDRNFYRFKVYGNGTPLSKVFIRNDDLNNGLKITEPLGPFFTELVPGDTAEVSMMCIDKHVYDYFFSLDQTLSGNSATPSNPTSNISGGCLGYFSAHTVSQKTIVIQK